MKIASAISYKEITVLEEIKEIVAFQAEIWSQEVVTTLPQLVAAQHHGGVIIGAFHEGRVVAFSYGFPGFKDGKAYLISHMTAVRTGYQNLGIGLKLKLKQREWAIDSGGYQKIVWTYDPLEGRNGYFNLIKLGGYAREYIHAYYGEMEDKLNKGLPTDRFLIEWDILTPRVEKALNQQLELSINLSNYPILLEVSDTEPGMKKKIGEERGYVVPVPKNIQEMKKYNIEAAKKWRFELRDLLTELLGRGYIVTGMVKDLHPFVHHYVIEKQLTGESHD
ncbi:hypothetical protein AF332_15400 [Sporosarcina globispora]|uniref:N-acetyltransferase domain-containing protein n=1 Tax=Sporosarcina globispora TaxID=1459 RepID=A0A0M0GEZ7_SPOGL|nr:GNAT family N-acetyltransferase [Sporosarcina globispora]KON88062.1 hypothetical protein AF332_15400 [Sporosarcina globispora]